MLSLLGVFTINIFLSNIGSVVSVLLLFGCIIYKI